MHFDIPVAQGIINKFTYFLIISCEPRTKRNVIVMRLHYKALLQIIMAAGIIRDAPLRKYYIDICNDLRVSEESEVPFATIFHTINESLKPFYMELKTVVVRDETNQRVYYHGFTNTQDDFVAQKHAGQLSEKEVTVYRHILDQLIIDIQMSSADINVAVRKLVATIGAFRSDEVSLLLNKLEQQGWLEKNDRNFWEVGPRAYLELRGHIEEVLRTNLGEEERDEEEGDEEQVVSAVLEERLARLPQILFY